MTGKQESGTWNRVRMITNGTDRHGSRGRKGEPVMWAWFQYTPEPASSRCLRWRGHRLERVSSDVSFIQPNIAALFRALYYIAGGRGFGVRRAEPSIYCSRVSFGIVHSIQEEFFRPYSPDFGHFSSIMSTCYTGVHPVSTAVLAGAYVDFILFNG